MVLKKGNFASTSGSLYKTVRVGRAPIHSPSLLRLRRAEIPYQVGSYFRISGVLGDHQIPTPEAVCIVSIFSTLWENCHVELSRNRAGRIGTQCVGVRPVAHEGRAAALPDVSSFFFAVGHNVLRSDRSYPASRRVERFNGVRIIDGDLPIGIDDGSASVAVNPFDRVTGYAFARLPLKDKTVKIRFASLAFAVLDLLPGAA